MRTALMLYGTLLFGMTCLRTDEEPRPNNPQSQPESPVKAEQNESDGQREANEQRKSDSRDAKNDAQKTGDKETIRALSSAFVKAYEAGDAKAAAAIFCDASEYVDEFGGVTQGRQQIQQMLADFFDEHPQCSLQVEIDSIRVLSPNLAIEDGSARVTHVEHLGNENSAQEIEGEHKDGETLVDPENLPGFTVNSRYTATYVKQGNQWQLASLRNYPHKGRKDHQSQVLQLKWLEGEWVDEGDDAMVTFSCKSADGGNYLLRRFAILVESQELLSGTQRIGWDPLARKLRSWIFDSEGGYASGFWHRDGDNWILKCAGVTAEGQTASYTAVYRLINEHTMTWQYVDHEVEGIQQPDSEVFTLVRRAPVPTPTVADGNKD